MFGNINTVKVAAELKKEAFRALDRGKNGPKTMRVDVNTLIDICIAFEAVSKGEYENLEYAVENYKEKNETAQSQLEELERLLMLRSTGIDAQVRAIVQEMRLTLL